MSDLAYNLQGERFEPPATATSWRVRRLKAGGRGTPDVVFSKDGAPLMLPLETDLVEFRRAVANQPGRYRLDPVTEDHRACEGGQPAYLVLSQAESTAEPQVGVRRNDSSPDDLLRELVRANTELCRNIADKFAGVMDSAAVLIRAADGAGLPARDPMVLPPHMANAWRNAELADTDDDEQADEHPTLAAVLQTTIDRAMPLVNHAVNTKVLGLSADQSIALMGGGVGSANAESATPKAKKKPGAPADPASPDFMPHLMAIEAQLSTEESALARQAIGEMAPEVLAAWREKLLAMSPIEAAAMIRTEVKHQTDDKSEAKKEAA